MDCQFVSSLRIVNLYKLYEFSILIFVYFQLFNNLLLFKNQYLNFVGI